MNTLSTLISMAVAIVVIAAGRTASIAQQRTSEGVPTSGASIEILNIPGGAAALPSLSASAIEVNSPFRQALFRKGLALRLIEIKAGYNSNDIEFVGMQVGGSTASGVQGVYAVLPYEVGMAFFPLPAPQVNLKLNALRRTYLKIGLQRSLDAAGGPATEARNHTGLRFAPKGDKVLAIEEAGFRRPATGSTRTVWFRAGYMRNSTQYLNFASGRYEAGNHAAFALMDVQLAKTNLEHPEHGIYAGVSAMTAGSHFNAYDRSLCNPASGRCLLAIYIHGIQQSPD